jgi:hypothetical protein
MDCLECRLVFPDPYMVSFVSAHSPQLPQSATQSSWILDSSTSSHMTPDSTPLGSMSSLPSPVSVKTVDDTPHPVVSLGTLCTTQFHVSFISHVPQLHLHLFFAGQM